jgi:sugar fermentation stimulation protein A
MAEKRKPLSTQGIEWPVLIPGVLMKRYKRFLADVQLNDGSVVTAHCPNSGTMKACSESGRPVYLSFHDNPKRKLKYTWELIEMPDSLVGVNTLVPNRLVKKSIEDNCVDELINYDQVRAEVKVGTNSRLDLLLRRENGERCFVEVKNCTLVEDKTAYFPDAVTDRGRKHLKELQSLISRGNRCVMFYLIQRMDAERFKPADHIDPAYGTALRKACDKGVEILVYDVKINLKEIRLHCRIPWELD